MTSFLATCKEVKENIMIDEASIYAFLGVFVVLSTGFLIALASGATPGTLMIASMVI